DEPEPPSCDERCDLSADRVERECLARGGSEDDCAARAAAYIEDCGRRCAGDVDPDEPCREPCDVRAERVREECLARGGDNDVAGEDRCREVVAAFLERCTAAAETVCEEGDAALVVAPVMFLRGDVNGDAVVDISDAVAGLAQLFLGREASACQDAADSNDDGVVNIADPVSVLNHLFLGAGALPEPFGREGHDPTSDDLICSPF
ncbi:MAG: dockerin type I repeat-containing protein, partial [Planctomycetota bacterium]